MLQAIRLLAVLSILVPDIDVAGAQASTNPCNGKGVPYATGFAAACVCCCGLAGRNCDAVPQGSQQSTAHFSIPLATWKDFPQCSKPGLREGCPSGMTCVRYVTGNNNCACTPNARNPTCTRLINVLLDHFEGAHDNAIPETGGLAKPSVPGAGPNYSEPASFGGCGSPCPSGFRCNPVKLWCECAPNSTAADCKCPGKFINAVSGKSLDCAPGPGGFCYEKSNSTNKCTTIFMAVMPASAGTSVCEPGLVFQNGNCVCAPLSTNAKCKPPTPTTTAPTPSPTPTPTPGSVRVCGNFNFTKPCTRPLNVSYAIRDTSNRVVVSGSQQLPPNQRILSVYSTALVNGSTYRFCATLPTTAFSFQPRTCSSYSGRTCCQNVRANTSSSSSGAGCAAFGNVFASATC